MCGTGYRHQGGIRRTVSAIRVGIPDTDSTSQDGMSNTSRGGTSGSNSTCQINTSGTSISDIDDYNRVGMERPVSLPDMVPGTSQDGMVATGGTSDDDMPTPHSGQHQENTNSSSCASSGGSEMIQGYSVLGMNPGSADSKSRLLGTPSEGSTATGSSDSVLLNSEETEESSLSDDVYSRAEKPRAWCLKEPEGRATDPIFHADVKL